MTMLSNIYSPYLVIAGALAVYGLAKRAFVSAQPIRLELADSGEALLARPELPNDLRKQTRYMLDHAFGSRWKLVVQIIAVPFFTLAIVFNHKYLKKIVTSGTSKQPLGAEYLEVKRLYDQVEAFNHPVLTFIYRTLLLLSLGMVILAIVILKGKANPRLNTMNVDQQILAESRAAAQRLHLAVA